MTVYNGEKYIRDAVDSILGQTLSDFELIIIDDDSRDRTVEVLKDYSLRDSRVKIIVNDTNIGFTQSLNRGIWQARGRYIARMDGDDIVHPERFARQVNFLEQNESVFIVGTYCYWINDDKQVIGQLIPLTDYRDMKKNLLGKCIAVHSSIIVRRELFDRIGLYDPRPIVEDELDLYARALKKDLKIANIPEFLMWRRAGGKTLSVSGRVWTFRVRAKYLPSFFSLQNLFYTLAYGLMCISPSSVRWAVFRWRNQHILRKGKS
jgi:glycosyltransferase involved in cell wall biosynthesis